MEYRGPLYGKIGKSYIPLVSRTKDVGVLEKEIELLKAKLQVAEKALSDILVWQDGIDFGDWEYPETFASRALEKIAKLDGF